MHKSQTIGRVIRHILIVHVDRVIALQCGSQNLKMIDNEFVTIEEQRSAGYTVESDESSEEEEEEEEEGEEEDDDDSTEEIANNDSVVDDVLVTDSTNTSSWQDIFLQPTDVMAAAKDRLAQLRNSVLARASARREEVCWYITVIIVVKRAAECIWQRPSARRG